VYTAVANGADTFDCVAPSRNARNGTVFHHEKRFHVTNGRYRRDFNPIDDTCDCYTCTHYTRAYLHHVFKSSEMIASTLATIHNERYIIRLIDGIRDSISDGSFEDRRQHQARASD
jgi:queuine tRNA-ribosyltransferase